MYVTPNCFLLIWTQPDGTRRLAASRPTRARLHTSTNSHTNLQAPASDSKFAKLLADCKDWGLTRFITINSGGAVLETASPMDVGLNFFTVPGKGPYATLARCACCSPAASERIHLNLCIARQSVWTRVLVCVVMNPRVMSHVWQGPRHMRHLGRMYSAMTPYTVHILFIIFFFSRIFLLPTSCLGPFPYLLLVRARLLSHVHTHVFRGHGGQRRQAV